MTRRPEAATAETGFRWGRAPTLAEAKFAEGEGIAEPDIAVAPDTARDIAPAAAAPETARLAHLRGGVAANLRKCRRIGPQPAQPRA